MSKFKSEMDGRTGERCEPECEGERPPGCGNNGEKRIKKWETGPVIVRFSLVRGRQTRCLSRIDSFSHP